MSIAHSDGVSVFIVRTDIHESRLTSLSCFSFRDAMYTLAPFWTYAAAIMVPMPDPPPVTTAVKLRVSVEYEAKQTNQQGAPGAPTDLALHVEQVRCLEVYIHACRAVSISRSRLTRRSSAPSKSEDMLTLWTLPGVCFVCTA